MKRNLFESKGVRKTAFTLCLAVLVLAGYSVFYNTAFSGYEPQGIHIWLSGSTVKFVNNWLKEGPLNLRFLMLEYPASIEFEGLTDRLPYISYPPGTILPPYLLAKLLHKSEINIHFIKQFLKMKYYLDTLLVCLVFWGLLTQYLKLTSRKWAAALSLLLSMSWMCLPIMLYYMRNIYFSDQCVITVVLLFILLEIYDDHFRAKSIASKIVYFVCKLLIALYGVLTDYYFLFVLFVAWLVKILPPFNRRSAITVKSTIQDSLVYVLPVLAGLSLFAFQLSVLPDIVSQVGAKMKFRTFSSLDGSGNNPLRICLNFGGNYGLVLTLFIIIFVSALFFVFIKSVKNRQVIDSGTWALLRICTIIYIAPVLQVLFLQNHSAVHEFSMIKFGLPVVLALLLSVYYLFHKADLLDSYLPMTIINGSKTLSLWLPVFYLTIILMSVAALFLTDTWAKSRYFTQHIGIPEDFEMEYLIRDNYDYNDVYFSFTESIPANPPNSLAISNKVVHKIEKPLEIYKMFPNLNKNARILFIVNKNNDDKQAETITKEEALFGTAKSLFQSGKYKVYEYHKPLMQKQIGEPRRFAGLP